MKINTTDLLADLKQRTLDNQKRAKSMLQLSEERLNQRPAPDSWSALECIEHLNRYGDFYLPEIAERIQQSAHPPKAVFKSGWLGNYFAKSMLPKEPLNTMTTFKSMDPSGSALDPSVISTFLQQQVQTLALLERAKGVGLAKTKTAISITKLIKLRLGDTLRVLIYHNQRHVLQAERAVGLAKMTKVGAY
ncbi:MAG TPA: DinB family protein [Phaeodactylibacter sp.]|nr:DinB family protein [Phaeodactylibacter sp.]